MSKKENIKQYYINKHINEKKEKFKLLANNIRLNKDYSLENRLWEKYDKSY